MSPLGKRVIVLFMLWVLSAMAIAQLYDNISGRNAPAVRVIAVPTPQPSVEADPQITRLADLQTCVNADPNDLACMTELAALYYDMGQYDAAQISYEAAVKLSPEDYNLLVKLAGTYIYQLKFESAVTTLRQAAILKPDSPEIHLLLGLSLSKVNPPKLTEAVAEWNKVIELAPGSDYAAQAAELINSTNNVR